MKFAASARERERARRLRRMKQVPLALLALMALLFVVTLDHPAEWARWAHAFAEAGMVGALADWFAVVALFKHPLGLPIPHTAIIPKRKDELGDAMSAFVSEHFLEPEVVRAKLETVDLAKYTTRWLASPEGQRHVAELAGEGIQWALGALHEERVRRFLGRVSRRQLQRLDVAPLAGRTLDWLVRGGRHQPVLTQALRSAIVLLEDHREQIRERIQHESPWWIPGFIDDRIVKKMMDRISGLLLEMSLDPDHPVREQFNQALRTLADQLQTDPEYRRLGDSLRDQLMENQTLQDYLVALWQDLAARLEADLAGPDSRTREAIRGWLATIATELEQDEAVQSWINQWLMNAAVELVSRNRDAIASLISDTVRTWDAQDTSWRVELAIGRDLQFIRINGTLVGGLVGVVIHALTRL